MNTNHIIPFLWLGNIVGAYDENFIKEYDIKLVVNCTNHIQVPEWYANYNIKTIRLPINDSDSITDNNILENRYNDIIDAIHKYRLQKMNVYVHCHAGIQRSATIIACYLMKYYKYKPEHAIYYIRNKRIIAFNPKPTFGRFLKNIEKNILMN